MSKQPVNVTCSLCGQDWFIRAVIMHTGQAIRVCPECDAIGLGHEADCPMHELDLEGYLKSLGRTTSWSELTIVDLWRFPEQTSGEPYQHVKYKQPT